MAGLIEIAATIMADAQRSVEVSAQNVSNITTAGYKRRIEFSSMMGSISEPEKSKLFQESAIDLAFGKISETGNPYDLGISGPGFFSVRSASGALLYTRDGQFSRDRDGRLVDSRGSALQADGADLVLRGRLIEVLGDGVVLEDGVPTARLDIVEIPNRAAMKARLTGGFEANPDGVVSMKTPSVRQGALETSNVTTAAEMVSVMAALRRAEAGQRLAIVYDDLMGRAITSFGQN